MDHLTVKEALPVFYKTFDLEPNGGINDSTVKITLFKGVHMYIPNFQARKKIVLKHDIHHLITGYKAVMKGEMEVSAWELSTGCHQNWVAFSLNTFGLMLGILINPTGVWKAWLRGRKTANLYDKKYVIDELLNRKVGDLKNELGFQNENHRPEHIFTALVSLIAYLIFGAVFSIASWIFVPFLILYSAVISIRNR